MTTVLRPADGATAPMGASSAFPIRLLRRLSRRVPTLLLVLVLSLCLLVLLTTGNPVAAAMPAVLALIVTLVWTQPVRRTLIPLVFAQLFFFSPSQGPDGMPMASGALWTNFVLPGHYLTNLHLNKSFGTSFLPLSGHELAYVLLFCLILFRAFRGNTTDAIGRKPIANVVFVFLLIQVAGVIAFEAWGLANNGNFRSTLFQIRHFLLLPLEAVVLCLALRDSRDFMRIALIATVAALLKGAIGLKFLVASATQFNYLPPYMTGHEDSVLFVLVMFMWIVAAVHTRSWQRTLMAILIFALLAVVVYYNNRRLAWVSLVAAFLSFFPLLQGRLRRRVNLGLIIATPFIFVYLMLSKTYTDGIFGPGADLMGIANVTDASSQWRILENANLVFTIDQHRFLGSGFGHEWIEVIKLPDVSGAFAEYRLLAHNSVLWLLGIVGSIGFTLIWMPIAVAVFLSRRSYIFSTTPYQRTAAASAIAAAVCYVNQAWGDVGLASAPPTFFMAASIALAAKLAHETGAWPAGTRLLNLKGTNLRDEPIARPPDGELVKS
jgi:hypothetical protein